MKNETHLTQHTPGPWAISPTGDIYSELKTTIDFGGTTGKRPVQLIVGKATNYTGNGAEAVANARLIAAAPDLLAALKDVTRLLELLNRVGANDPIESAVFRARAAIAKAEKGVAK